MKSLDRFIEEAAKSVSPKKCPPGSYYCFDEKKCKRIPGGYHVGRGGILEPDSKKKNGNGGKSNGNGNGNGNGNSNGSANGNGSGNGGNGGSGNGGGGSGGVGEEGVNLPLHIRRPRNQTEFNLGLMFEKNLDPDTGMLFEFEESGEKYFYMKNTYIPLDIAFINEDGIIENIKELEPLMCTPVSSDSNVLYALEVNRGWFDKNNVKIGDKVLDI